MTEPVAPPTPEQTAAAVETQPARLDALKTSKQPFWLSAGWTAYIATIVAIVAALFAPGAHDVATTLATGAAAALPAIILGGKAVDWQRTKQIGESKP